MKTPDEILQYIQTYYQRVLDVPERHYRFVACMENELATLEALCEYIVSDSTEYRPYPVQFVEFLCDKGYGMHGFSHGKIGDDDVSSSQKAPVKAASTEEVEKMKQFSAFWREYLLSTRGRDRHERQT